MEDESPEFTVNDENAAHFEVGEDMLAKAKLNKDTLENLSQTIVVDHPLDSDQFTLVEITQELLEQIKKQDSIVLRGEIDENPVLCTNDETYDVKEAQTSNALLLVPELAVHSATKTFGQRTHKCVKMVGIRHAYLELKPKKIIQLDKLKHVLQTRSIDEDNASVNNFQCQKQLTMADLLDSVQGSETEIRAAIERLPVIQIDDAYFWINEEYMCNLIAEILSASDEEKFEWSKFDPKDLIVLFPNVKVEIIQKIIDIFASKIPDNSDKWAFSESKIGRVTAEGILRTAKCFLYNDFWKTWEDLLPIGMTPKTDYLKGIGKMKSESNCKVIEYFPYHKLPTDPQQRLEILFRKQSKWTRDELEGYLEDLTVTGMSVPNILAKYSRSYVDSNNVKFYTTK